ncbi:twin-arginine translocase subunit TatC [Desulfitobacterium sp.]|uniref:twin-arginine translocase subunit TatC n=1 Tax=Desulfitobacterium sp. TaxID=49981 RepID=UPI002B20A842|nr:twin-arginine translocase subunit TatC [Desulfitobacterium sp.]MEA4902586.1 twin-arginine translocase subunit TatC [Desulfitobacterium sp.]
MRRRKVKDDNMPLMEHIRALRKVLVVSAYGIALGSVLGWAFSDKIYEYLASPVLDLISVSFVTTTPMEPIMVKLKVSIVTGIVVALPILLWQLWSFILPALKQNEKKYLYIIVPSSLVLFVLGAAFGFYFVLPIGVKFLLFTGGSIPSTTMVTQSSYLSFLITFILVFGILFQLPVVLLLLIRMGIVRPQTLAKKRKWAFFGIVAVTMFVSPTPDVVTQFLMAGPVYLLYEISIWLGYIVVKNRDKALSAS